MNRKIKGLALYLSAAVILQFVVVPATAMAKSEPFDPKDDFVSGSSRATSEGLAILAAVMKTADDSAYRLIDKLSKITVKQDPNRLDITDESLADKLTEPSHDSARRLINTFSKITVKQDPNRLDDTAAASLADKLTQPAHDSARRLIDKFSKITDSDRLDDTNSSLEDKLTDSEPAQVRATRMIHSENAAENNTIGELEGNTTNDSSVNSSTSETESSLTSINPSEAVTSVSPAVESDAKSAPTSAQLGTSEVDMDVLISLLGNDTESEPSLESDNSSAAITKLTDYLISLGTYNDLRFLNDITDASYNSTTNSSSESLDQYVPASILDNTNIGTSEQFASLESNTESNFGKDPDNVTTNIMNLNVSNNTSTGRSKLLTSPLRGFIDVINNVFGKNNNPFYHLTADDTHALGDRPASRNTFLNLSDPEILKLDTKPVKSVYDFLSRVSEANHRMYGEYAIDMLRANLDDYDDYGTTYGS